MMSRREVLIAASSAALGTVSGVAGAQPSTYDRIIDVYDPNNLCLEDAKKNDVGAIIYQVGQGRCVTDTHYKEYRAQAKAKGFLWGAYYVLSAEDNHCQVKQLASLESGQDVSNLVAIDWQTACGGRMTFAQLQDFVHRFIDQFGFYPMIYGGEALRKCPQLAVESKFFAKCPLWYQSYGKAPLGLPTKTWPTYTLWQYDDEHRKNGAPKKILPGADWSRYPGTFDQLKKEWPFRRAV